LLIQPVNSWCVLEVTPGSLHVLSWSLRRPLTNKITRYCPIYSQKPAKKLELSWALDCEGEYLLTRLSAYNPNVYQQSASPPYCLRVLDISDFLISDFLPWRNYPC
jgi:hypothetical protein